MNEWYVALTVVGGWGWVFSLIFFFLRAFPAQNRFDASQALRWGGSAVAGFVLWVVGMLVT